MDPQPCSAIMHLAVAFREQGADRNPSSGAVWLVTISLLGFSQGRTRSQVSLMPMKAAEARNIKELTP